jgi:hypothetical protein
VFREIDLTHTTNADLVENPVRSKAKTLVFALENELRLKFSQNPRLNEARGRIVRAGGQRTRLQQKSSQDIIICQFAFANQFQNGITCSRRLGHIETHRRSERNPK